MEPSVEYLEALMAAIKKHDIHEFNLESGKMKISLNRHHNDVIDIRNSPAPIEHHTAADFPSAHETITQSSPLLPIHSPLVGTYYHAQAPDAPPFVSPGQAVVAGSTLCIIEAMKTMNEIKAPQNGIIVDIMAQNGSLIEHGQLLFRIKPESTQ